MKFDCIIAYIFFLSFPFGLRAGLVVLVPDLWLSFYFGFFLLVTLAINMLGTLTSNDMGSISCRPISCDCLHTDFKSKRSNENYTLVKLLIFSIYSRLSLSRNRRDPQKYFEISVLRHIRHVVLRKKQFEQPKFTNDYII